MATWCCLTIIGVTTLVRDGDPFNPACKSLLDGLFALILLYVPELGADDDELLLRLLDGVWGLVRMRFDSLFVATTGPTSPPSSTEDEVAVAINGFVAVASKFIGNPYTDDALSKLDPSTVGTVLR